MWLWENKTSDLEDELDALEKENERLSWDVTVYKQQLEDQNDISKASFSVDWEAMNAFSIERNWDNRSLRTIIGYMLQEPATHTEGENGEQRVTYRDVVREWTLQCSPAEHERLVKEFNAYVKGKNK